MATDHKENILSILETLKKRDFANNDRWKVRAYVNVINQIKLINTPITSMDDLKNVKGIGEKIKLKLEEIMTTGDLTQVHNIDKEVAIVTDLSRVFGIGPVRAKELYEKHGIEKVDDLLDHMDLLNDKQQIGMKYYKDFELRIKRAEMEKHADFIKQAIQKLYPELTVEVMGSYRRGARDSGDIDVLITHKDDPENYTKYFDDVVKNLVDLNYVVDTFAKGNKKFNGVCRLKRHKFFRRLDIMYTRKQEWPFALLYFTGDQNFNIILRKMALDKHMSLNEYGLKHTEGEKGKMVDATFESEKDVFEFLGVKYVAPEDRNSRVKFERI